MAKKMTRAELVVLAREAVIHRIIDSEEFIRDYRNKFSDCLNDSDIIYLSAFQDKIDDNRKLLESIY